MLVMLTFYSSSLLASMQVLPRVYSMAAGFQSLKEDTPQVLSLFCELLQQPQLPEEKIQLVKNQVGRCCLQFMPVYALLTSASGMST